MTSTRRSFVVSFAEKYALLLLSIVGTMTLGRLLTPAEIGAYSVAAVMVGVANVLRDFGVSQFLIQERELTADKLRAALSISVFISWVLASALLVASAPMAQFYGAPPLQTVLRVLAFNLMVLPFTAVYLPCLRRDMRFAAIFSINLASSVVQLACSATLAWLGYGSLSLAWSVLAGSGAGLLASLCFRDRRRPWLPGLRGIRKILSFSGYAAAGGLIDEIGEAAPDLIVGKLIGMEGVGLFSKAQGLVSMFNQLITSAVTPVIFPLFAAQARGGLPLEQTYLRTVSCMTALAWPFFAFLGLMALPIVRVLSGDQWDAAVPLVRVVCCGAALYAMFSMSRHLLVATGHVKAQATLDALTVPVRLLALLAGARFGLIWVAWAVLAGMLFRCWLTWRYLRQLTTLTVGALLLAVRRSAVLALLAALPPLAVLMTVQLGPGHHLGLLLGTASCTLVLWLAGLVLLKHELAGELAPLARKLQQAVRYKG